MEEHQKIISSLNRQDDPISTYIFIIAFLFIMQNENINGLKIFKKHFYAQCSQMIKTKNL